MSKVPYRTVTVGHPQHRERGAFPIATAFGNTIKRKGARFKPPTKPKRAHYMSLRLSKANKITVVEH